MTSRREEDLAARVAEVQATKEGRVLLSLLASLAISPDVADHVADALEKIGLRPLFKSYRTLDSVAYQFGKYGVRTLRGTLFRSESS